MNSDELAQAIETDLTEAGLRGWVNGIEPNQGAGCEVVLWPDGKPVRTVAEARHYVEQTAEFLTSAGMGGTEQ